ncbi:MAG TPA: 2,3-diphosphoglycerate-dependent phosphoglycerate mutase, partial [Acidobacteriota bacterium]|nr:2,3-diphosphoglycerate-dependent phosphoglycerate mutase [Acidobacteriota bacterium]
MIKLVLMRHGWSQWNEENRFTGWADVPLHPKGIVEASQASLILKENKIEFDIVFCAPLQRAKHTTELALAYHKPVPIFHVWDINERHYGGLQGLDKAETARKFSVEQVQIWRRSYAIQPPKMTQEQWREQRNEPIFFHIPDDKLPWTESLKDTLARVLPWFETECVPHIKQKKRVFISAHGNSLRALVKHLDNVADDEIVKLTIPTAIPLVYELDEQTLKPIRRYYLGDEKV